MLFKQQCQGEADSTWQHLCLVLPSSALHSREPNLLTTGHSSRPCLSLLGPAVPPTWQEWACHIWVPCAQDEVACPSGYIHRKDVELSDRRMICVSTLASTGLLETTSSITLHTDPCTLFMALQHGLPSSKQHHHLSKVSSQSWSTKHLPLSAARMPVSWCKGTTLLQAPQVSPGCERGSSSHPAA